jgi:hypothetical protein
LIRIPNRDAAASAATIAVGVASTNAHGHDTTSTEITRFKSWVNTQTKAPITNTTGV